MEESGVRYALVVDGSVADPKTAPKLERHYRCFDCGEHVHVRRGEVRKPYFAHYAERPHPCSAETIAHEAAKRKLVALLLEGARSFGLLLACRGYTDAFGDAAPCPDEARLERPLEVPNFDRADVEVAFGNYRLDAAASLNAQVVLGLEVYQSHLVDAPKRAALTAAGLPWAELYAEEVLGQPMPWEAVTSNFGPHRCRGCAKRDAAVLAERRRREAAEAARREAEKRATEQQAEHEAHNARIVQVARKGKNLIFGRRDRIGMVFTCLVCKEPVTATQVEPGSVVFLHQPGKACDARRAWVRAGMWEVLKQLERAPKAVRVHRRCSDQECKHVFKEPLPEFDAIGCEEPSLVLSKDGAPVIQLVFGSEPRLVGVAEVLELRPGKVSHKPAVWWQRRNGTLCDLCTKRLVEAETAAQARREAFALELEARQQAEAEILRRRNLVHTEPAAFGWNSALHLTRLRRKAAKLEQALERVEQAARFAKSYLKAQGVDLARARTFGVVVRRCEHCRGSVALLYVWGVQAVPAGLEHVLAAQPNRAGLLVYNRCGRCSGRLHNDLEGADRAVYLLPEHLT